MILGVLFLLSTHFLQASVFKGDATLAANGDYKITDGTSISSGGVFSTSTLNINSGFDINFQVKVSASSGSEGFCFVLLDRNTVNLGNGGGGIGYKGIDTSLGIEFDTHDNGSSFNDNSSDHMAVRKNGLFSSSGNLSGTISTINLEDNTYHTIRVRYLPSTTKLEVYIDGTRKVNLTINLRTSIFFGDSLVYWGITAANSSGSCQIIMKNFSTPLPVNLLSFEGMLKDHNIYLTWSTGSEYNAEKFEILKSSDGLTWERAGTVPCFGNSASLRTYNYTDEAGNGVIYYRLKQTDFDGKEELFRVISISCLAESEVKHSFYDLTGRKVYFGTTESFLQQCEPGVIFISDTNKRFLKQ